MDTIIEVEGLKKSYKKRRSKEFVHAVDDVSFTVNRGEILGLLGPNGAGKTTTIKMICGLLIPDSGSIVINGINSRRKRLDALRHISAVLEGNRNLYWRLTVKENLDYFAGNRGLSRKEVRVQIEDLLKKFSLKEKQHELVNRLSRGMQQKLAIAVAMLADSEVILLDEPTLGLDVETGYEVRDLLRSIVKDDNRTIIISSHDMDVVQDLCNRTVIIDKGKIVTNDKVENLLRLFQVRAYTITLGGLLSDQQHQCLLQKFPQLEYTTDTIQSTLEIDLVKSEEIYDLFDVLKMENTFIESIDRSTINFEQIFMKIVKEGAEGCTG
ncbi:ABC-2 type transport system ATP-binding protein [Virgibacillus halotolerans]|uniref:ABC transporter ATP-binding protein n=1 Tax=Virgibacillus halotolerans TaxID=1071053 RepID=UPI0019605D20|nr:ABC transporter ATP-binding protein [Virgibacillus halotolerans]MBM7600384.1 ABC-2 type transport system ATP-binding protein [Virgibacillus halotolerans]